MKVLQVAHYYGPLGGIERVVYQFCHALKNDHEVEVLACNQGPRTLRTVEEGIPVTRVGRVAHVNRMSVCPTFPYWMRKKNPDVVHIHMINPLAEMSFLLSGLKCKVLATYHMDLTRQRFLSSLYSPAQRRFVRRTSLITTSSENFARTSPVLAPNREKVRILPYGISTNHFEENEESAQILEGLRSEISGKVVLFVGRLIHYKGLDTLVEAMRNVDATCLVVGDGYLKGSLESQIAESGLEGKVQLVGRVSDEELLAYYDRADVFALPSTGRTESYGLTQIEAMSRGTPLVCTEVGTGTTFVNKEGVSGLVVPPSDPGALAEAMNRILTDDDLAARLGRGGRDRFEELFTEEKMVANLRDLYREVLKE